MHESTEVDRIRKFARYARACCVLLAAMSAILGIWTIGNIVLGPGSADFRIGLGAYDVHGDQLATLGVKTWAFTVVASVYAIVFIGLFHLYCLFGSLAGGAIYTRDNVLRIRRLGELAMAMAVLQLVLPPLSLMVLSTPLIEESAVTPVTRGAGPDSLSLLITAGLVLLASWIMEVGRQTRVEAEEMRREVELTV